ncbi:VirB8/TrbF family protein [Terricaulis sp.]|uniref:VirB8/TrbF family protein n=1 Tax=Terricaulis sp. TaxID=2768686 RepID=UPI002AC51030|nr:VirB8/TrbF family protein [Terricaulis sp.]MDZ4690302.1 VirB8/TrbF family protein [Terricaulis sp.]
MRLATALSLSVIAALASLSAATQTVAALFQHQNALGAPALRLAGIPIYWPFSILVWSTRWRDVYPKPFAVAEFAALASAAGVVIIGVAVSGAGAPTLRRHGQNGWARFADARAAQLFASCGATLGKFEGEIIAYDGPGHLLLVGASRSGKGRGHVVPTLLSWPRSALVLDVKGELADGDGRHGFVGVAGFRERLGSVVRFAPTSAASARFNPLLEVRKGENEVRDVQNVVEIIVDPAGDGRQADFWDRSAKQILTGLILHVLYSEPDERKTLSVVREKLRDLDTCAEEMRQLLHRRCPVTGAPQVHPEVLHAAESYLASEERVRSGVKATANAYKFLTPQAAAQLNEMARADDPFLSLGRVGRTVHVRSVIARSDRSWEVSWIERATNSVGSSEPQIYSGVFTVTVRPPRNADDIAANPLGLLIEDFSWSRER